MLSAGEQQVQSGQAATPVPGQRAARQDGVRLDGESSPVSSSETRAGLNREMFIPYSSRVSINRSKTNQYEIAAH